MEEQTLNQTMKNKIKNCVDTAESACIVATDNMSAVVGDRITCITCFANLYKHLIEELDVPKEELDVALKVALMSDEEMKKVSENLHLLEDKLKELVGNYGN